MSTTTDRDQWLKLAAQTRESDAAKAEPRPVIDGLNKPDLWKPPRSSDQPTGNDA